MLKEYLRKFYFKFTHSCSTLRTLDALKWFQGKSVNRHRCSTQCNQLSIKYCMKLWLSDQYKNVK